MAWPNFTQLHNENDQIYDIWREILIHIAMLPLAEGWRKKTFWTKKVGVTYESYFVSGWPGERVSQVESLDHLLDNYEKFKTNVRNVLAYLI